MDERRGVSQNSRQYSDFDEMLSTISQELQISVDQVRNTVYFLDDEKTIAFIARYRKEATKSLNEIQIRQISERIQYLRKLKERKESVEASIREQEKWNEALEKELAGAQTLQEVENLYQPYKKHKKTKADIAREKGLEPLCVSVKNATVPLETEFSVFINEDTGYTSEKEVLRGVLDILREEITYSPEIRKRLYNAILEKGWVETEQLQAPDPKGVFKDFYAFRKPLKNLENHRILAINRGEKAKVLRVKITLPASPFQDYDTLFDIVKGSVYYEDVQRAFEDGYSELLFPSVVREVRNTITEKAEKRAIEVFAKNLRYLMLVPPLRKKRILGIDPGLRTGCKCAVIDENGSYLDAVTIFPNAPHKAINESEKTLLNLYENYHYDIIAIGNGTASRETEEFVAQWISKHPKNAVGYLIVSEAGASVYSASESGIEEFPELDVTTRGAISIARRVQDPLAELVKIPPESIGVGMYQHDVSETELQRVLKLEVESVVNYVGIDLNQASPFLMQYVSGLNSAKSWKIFEYRKENGAFRRREELKKVKGIGEKTYELAAGFCRVPESEEPLDNTVIHPESYESVKRLLLLTNLTFEEIEKKPDSLSRKIEEIKYENIQTQFGITEVHVHDIIEALTLRHVDPRDEFPQPVLKKEIRSLEDLTEGMELEGTVRNVVDFGAFVDIGVKIDGLIHQSQFGKKWANPLEKVYTGEIIRVKILKVDRERERINLAYVQKP
jgi:uncharacterized protein